MGETGRVLFVCVENAGRSQMAEAFFRKYAPEKFHAASAGTSPGSRVNPVVVRAMREEGIDISQKPKPLSGEMAGTHLRIVNMGCLDRDQCPGLFTGDVLDWNIEDPKGEPIEKVRVIRDQIKSRVCELIEQLEKGRR